MKLITCVTTVVVTAALTACGGSNSDTMVDNTTGGSTAVNTVEPDTGAAIDSNGEDVVVVPPAPVPQVQTADLQASETFNFATSWDMDINFQLPMNNTYLSLCKDYEATADGSVEVQFDSCIVRAPISDGTFMSEDVPMTNEISSLVAVLIDYANPSVPLYVEFEVTPGKESLEWSEGVSR